jgi:hypothetical protein
MLTTPKVSIPALKETTDAMAQGDHQMCPHTLPQQQYYRKKAQDEPHCVELAPSLKQRARFRGRWIAVSCE